MYLHGYEADVQRRLVELENRTEGLPVVRHRVERIESTVDTMSEDLRAHMRTEERLRIMQWITSGLVVGLLSTLTYLLYGLQAYLPEISEAVHVLSNR